MKIGAKNILAILGLSVIVITPIIAVPTILFLPKDNNQSFVDQQYEKFQNLDAQNNYSLYEVAQQPKIFNQLIQKPNDLANGWSFSFDKIQTNESSKTINFEIVLYDQNNVKQNPSDATLAQKSIYNLTVFNNQKEIDDFYKGIVVAISNEQINQNNSVKFSDLLPSQIQSLNIDNGLLNKAFLATFGGTPQKFTVEISNADDQNGKFLATFTILDQNEIPQYPSSLSLKQREFTTTQNDNKREVAATNTLNLFKSIDLLREGFTPTTPGPFASSIFDLTSLFNLYNSFTNAQLNPFINSETEIIVKNNQELNDNLLAIKFNFIANDKNRANNVEISIVDTYSNETIEEKTIVFSNFRETTNQLLEAVVQAYNSFDNALITVNGVIETLPSTFNPANPNDINNLVSITKNPLIQNWDPANPIISVTIGEMSYQFKIQISLISNSADDVLGLINLNIKLYLQDGANSLLIFPSRKTTSSSGEDVYNEAIEKNVSGSGFTNKKNIEIQNYYNLLRSAVINPENASFLFFEIRNNDFGIINNLNELMNSSYWVDHWQRLLINNYGIDFIQNNVDVQYEFKGMNFSQSDVKDIAGTKFAFKTAVITLNLISQNGESIYIDNNSTPITYTLELRTKIA